MTFPLNISLTIEFCKGMGGKSLLGYDMQRVLETHQYVKGTQDSWIQKTQKLNYMTQTNTIWIVNFIGVEHWCDFLSL